MYKSCIYFWQSNGLNLQRFQNTNLNIIILQNP